MGTVRSVALPGLTFAAYGIKPVHQVNNVDTRLTPGLYTVTGHSKVR